jgi:hypothetical protein
MSSSHPDHGAERMITMVFTAVLRKVDPFGNVPKGADDHMAAASFRADGVSAPAGRDRPRVTMGAAP